MSEIEIDCIFCRKHSKCIDWKENGYTGKRCECGLLYVSPRPSLKEMTEWYNSKEANLSATSRIQSELLNRLNGRYRLKLLKKYIKKGRLLEIGPGSGYFLDESKRNHFDPFGVELNLRQAKFIEENLRISVETNPFTEFSFPGIYFDIICHFDVISHFYDPIYQFKIFNRRLNEGGILFFETGNGGDLSRRWFKFIGKLQYPQHLFLFSKKNIEQLCHQTGFEIINIYQYSISLHLFLIKLFLWMRACIGRFIWKKGNKVVSDNFKGISRGDRWWKALPLKIAIFMNFFIKYKVGKFLPRIGPQTIIYVAKKVATIDLK